MTDTQAVREDVLFYKLKDLITEQSEGEWDDVTIIRDARHFANHLRPLMAAAPSVQPGADREAEFEVIRVPVPELTTLQPVAQKEEG